MYCETSGRNLRNGLVLLGVLAALSPLVGCSRRESAPVSGRVTLNGEPQEGIYVYFQPTVPPGGDPMNVGTSSYARTDADGKFTLNFMDTDKDRPGALVGTHTVRMDDERTFGGGTAPDDMSGGGGGPRRSRVPKGWTQTFEVSPEGTTEANFELNQR